MPVKTFTVESEPMGAPRMTRADSWRQRPVVVRYRRYKDAIRKAAGTIPNALDVLSVNIVAHFSPPSSWSKKRRAAAVGALHRQKPDCDNVAKGVMDSLWSEDSAIARLTIEKRWSEIERLEVEIAT